MPVFYSDHNTLSVSCHINLQRYGKLYWKLNNTLLNDRAFNKNFRVFFKGFAELKCFYSSKR